MNSPSAGFTTLLPQVTVLKMRNQGMINYNYLVVDPNTRQAVIVDPAWEMDKVVRALDDANASLSGVLITHSHHDHIDLAREVADKFACPIWMSAEEIAFSGFNAKQLVAIDTNAWFVGKMQINPIVTPGHTPGCVCYQIGDNLFTGDVLFAEGCGICFDVPGAHAMFDSLEYLKARLKPQTRIYPGHSYGKTPGRVFSRVMRENMYLQFSDKASFAAFRLRSGQSRSKLLKFS
jgi:hydroxyacylglutathione hydrolase